MASNPVIMTRKSGDGLSTLQDRCADADLRFLTSALGKFDPWAFLAPPRINVCTNALVAG